MLADTIEPEEAAGFSPTRFSTITYAGVANGLIVLSANEPFVIELASSLLGVDEEDVNSQIEGCDALNELANIIGGSVILDLGGAEHHYEYGLPKSVTGSELPSETPDTVKCYLESESGILSVAWCPNMALGDAAA